MEKSLQTDCRGRKMNRYDFLVTGICKNTNGEKGGFSLCVMDNSANRAEKEAVRELEEIGYSDIEISKTYISRFVCDE